jgi:hypothetical protein
MYKQQYAPKKSNQQSASFKIAERRFQTGISYQQSAPFLKGAERI